MTQLLFFGCFFVAFAPIITFFFMVISKNSQLIILSIGGSFFWLVSALIASVWWFIIVPMRESFWFTIPFSIAFQEVFRYIFYRLYAWGFNERPSLAQIETLARQAAQEKRSRTTSAGDESMSDISAASSGVTNRSSSNKQQKESMNQQDLQSSFDQKQDSFASSSISSINNNDKNNNNNNSGNQEQQAVGQSSGKEEYPKDTEINTRLETLSARPNHTLSAAAIGTGSGITYAFIMYASILWESTGPGALFSESCPTVNLFMISALTTLFITILHVAFNILAFQGYRSKKYHLVLYVLLAHFAVSYLTLLNQKKSCIGSLVPITGITIFTVIFSIYSLLRSDSITKIN
ncbi:hypothetical protein CYY_005333 [Polysphondylium violaceum]|uniref:Gamma-secretase subunit Aph-1 n=1 Tax=Polysphondylium violaceum TaxID=133409 RepID=A0A8J4UZP3_9MYCE|nr:hypothetical protein CYY_005333 [Polysphondylium violaceum]